MITDVKEYKCQCNESCERPLLIRDYDGDRLEFEIDGNAVVLNREQLEDLQFGIDKFLKIQIWGRK